MKDIKLILLGAAAIGAGPRVEIAIGSFGIGMW
jgi:hypothetical protein